MERIRAMRISRCWIHESGVEMVVRSAAAGLVFASLRFLALASWTHFFPARDVGVLVH